MAPYFQKLSTAGFTAITIGSSVLISGVGAAEFSTIASTTDVGVKRHVISPETHVGHAVSTQELEFVATLATVRQVSEGDTSYQSLIESSARSRRVTREEIVEFADLGASWDGEDASQISPVAIRLATSFLDSYEGLHFFSAFPDPDGSVGLQSELQTGRVLLSFCEDGTIAYLIRKSMAVHRGHGASKEDVERLLKSFA